ncbi:MAG: helicase-related protein [Nitrospira sp.]|nr:helicase-related protein [Nitrospira sp.]
MTLEELEDFHRSLDDQFSVPEEERDEAIATLEVGKYPGDDPTPFRKAKREDFDRETGKRREVIGNVHAAQQFKKDLEEQYTPFNRAKRFVKGLFAPDEAVPKPRDRPKTAAPAATTAPSKTQPSVDVPTLDQLPVDAPQVKPRTLKATKPLSRDQIERQMVEAGQSFDLPEPSVLDLYKQMPGMGEIANLTEQRNAKTLMEAQRPGAKSLIPPKGPGFTDPKQEARFQRWYKQNFADRGLNPDPDNPNHFYDYRRAFADNMQLVPDPTDLDEQGRPRLHGSSKYKLPGHPREFVDTPDGRLNTITGKIVNKPQPGHSIIGMDGEAIPLPDEPTATEEDVLDVPEVHVSGKVPTAEELAGQFTADIKQTGQDIQDAPPIQSVRQGVEEAAYNFMQGLAQIPADALKSIAVASKSLDRILPESLRDDRPIEQRGSYQLGVTIDKMAKRLFPADPAMQKNFVAGVLPRAVGSMVGFMAGGVAGLAAKAPLATTAVLGAGVGGVEQYEDAKEKTASPDVQEKAFWLGSAVGSSEALPIAGIINRFNKATGGRFVTVLKESGVTAAQEFIQEYFQQTGSNIVAQQLYDENRSWFEGAGMGGAAGGGSGAIVGFLSGVLQSRKARRQQEQPQTESPLFTEPEPVSVQSHVSSLPDEMQVTQPGQRPPFLMKQPQAPSAPPSSVPPPEMAVSPNQEVSGRPLQTPEAAITQEPIATPSEPLVAEQPPVTPTIAPDPIDDDMREALDQDLDFLEESPGQTPGLPEPVPQVEPEPVDATYALPDEPVTEELPSEPRIIPTRDGRFQVQRPDGTYLTNPATGGNEFKTEAKARAALEQTIDVKPKKPKQQQPALPAPDDPIQMADHDEVLEVPEVTVEGTKPTRTVADIHKLADEKGIPWDNNPAFMDFTEEKTGKRHLDELSPDMLEELAIALEIMQAPKQASKQPEKEQVPTPETVTATEQVSQRDPMVGPLQPGELSFEDFLQQTRFYRSGKTKNAQVPGGERVILKDDSTAGNFREKSRNFLKGVYGNYIAKLRKGKTEEKQPQPKADTPEEVTKKTPAYTVTSAELVPTRGPDGRIQWVAKNVTEEQFPEKAETPPKASAQPTPEEAVAKPASSDFAKHDRVEWMHDRKKLTGIVRTVSSGGNIEVARTNGQTVILKPSDPTLRNLRNVEAAKPTHPSLEAPAEKAGVVAPAGVNFDDLRSSAVDAQKAFNQAKTIKEKSKWAEKVRLLKKHFTDGPGLVGGEAYAKRLRFFDNILSKMHQALEDGKPIGVSLLPQSEPQPTTPEALAQEPKRDTLTVPPTPEEVANERTQQPRVDAPRPPERAPTDPVSSLEEPGATQQVSPKQADRDQRGTDVSRGTGDAAPRGKRDASERDLSAERGGREDAGRDDEAVSGSDQPAGTDFTIGADYTIPSGQKTKYKANVSAIKLLKQLETEGRLASPAEQAVLAQYTGWGGLPQAFQWSHEWQKEYRELEDLLTDEEYASARASTPNAHYTDPDTIRSIYTGLEHLGFTHGRVLEPGAGIGHFFGVMPAKMASRSQRTAIEKDSISARIAAQLYQRANVREGAYEQQALPNEFFDVAVGNVPFADVRPHDAHNQDLNKLHLSLHDYYFAKAISQVRPGGLVAFITSRFTMDKLNGKLRDYLAKRADLVGAIRLPNTQFKAIANTDVTTDVIVLRRRQEGEDPGGEAWATTETQATPDGDASINEYFVRHPEHIMGTLSLEGTMYRSKEVTVKPDGRNVPSAMADAFRKMPADIYQARTRPVSTTPRGLLEALEASDDVKEGAYTIQNNALYVRRSTQFVPVEDATATDIERARGLIAIREQVKSVLKSQLEDTGAPFMAAQRKELNKVYDRFQKKFGFINSRANKALFRDDPDYGTLQSLERDYDKKANTANKADIFSKRIIEYRPSATKADTPKEAMLISLNETGRIDLDKMQALTGRPQHELIRDLKGLVYQNPEGLTWEPADQYLSGNVRQKLRVAEEAAKTDKRFNENVESLKLAIPEDLKPEQIAVKLGHGWIPANDYRDFIAHLLDINTYNVKVNYSAVVGAFSVKASAGMQNVKNTKTFGTDRATATSLLEDALASKLPTVYDALPDDKRIVNEKETIAAREKLQAIQDEFQKWLWADQNRADRLARKYNDEYNNIRVREHDGSHLSLPGSNPLIVLRPHQKNGVWRALQEGNTLLAHEVGAGKTYTKIAIAMEFRRLRMANKPLITVPNHLVEYWRGAFLELYPAAKVLAATKEDFKAENRRRLVGRIATGDWDAVVIAHSQMSRIPMSYESFEAFAKEQIDLLDEYLHELKADKQGNRNIIKEIEKAKARFEGKLKSRKAQIEENADKGVTFEETGVDMILVDEADLFKNLWFPTRMTRVAGLPNTESQRSYDMFLKTNYLNKLTNQRAVIFGTATPISNSMAEVFTMQRYLQPRELEQAGLSHFDAWARQFGNTVTSLELSPDGSGYRPKTRFAEFVNVPELTQMFRRVMDVKTGEDLKLPVPKLRTGKPINVTVPPSEALKTYVASLITRAEALKTGRVDPRKDNMLKITGDGRNAALDVRLRVPGAPEDKHGKVAAMVKQVVQEYKDSATVKGTQLIFLDLSTPKAKDTKDKKETEDGAAQDEEVELAEEQQLRGSVYQDIKKKLIRGGIPEKEIAFIHDAKTDEKKTKLFEDVNAGTIRVLIGSTEKMGAGTNVQKKMVALHNLDAPWRPRDIHQRNGRGIRQGNELYRADPDGFEFAVFNYATEAPSFDVFMWGTLEAKARTITQIMKGDPNIRTIQDVDTAVMSFAEMKAVASGNPMVLEKANKDIELRKLSLLRAAHQDTQRRIAYELRTIPDQIKFEKDSIARFEKAEEIADAHPADPFTVTLNKTAYTDKTEAGQAVLRMIQDALDANPKSRSDILRYPGIGTYRGFSLHLNVHIDNSAYFYVGENRLLTTTSFMLDEVKPENVMVRFENAIAALDSLMAKGKKNILIWEKKRQDMLEEQKKPFEHEAKILALESRIKQIDTALDLTKRDEGVIAEAAGKDDEGPLDILKSERGSIPASLLAGGAGTAKDAEAYRQQRAREDIGFQSADPEIDRRVRAAKRGIQKDSLSGKLKEHLGHVWRLISREFANLPDTAQFARLRTDLLKLQKYKGIAADEIQRELAAIVKPLNRKQYDQLEWKALLADLQREADAGRKLPFGYTAEKVADDLESLDAAISLDQTVQKSWEKRQQLWKRLKKEYQGAMNDIGFDVTKKLTKEDYFRHQVLDHARERAMKGTGSKIRTPTGRGFLQTRHGSSADINANYVQAEFEVMAQMVYDTQVAKVIKGVDQTLNIRKSLEAQAKDQNNKAIQAIIDEGSDRSAIVAATLKDFRKRLGMHMSRIRKAMQLSQDDRLSLPEIAEIAEDVENDAHLSARGVFKVINERKVFVDQLLGKKKVTWEQLIPDTHDLWQPREGNVFYMADSIPAQLAKALQESMLEDAGLLADKLRKVLAMGAPREQYVIPIDAKETLDDLSHKEHSWFVDMNRQFLGHWKQLMLIAPRKWGRYNIRNFTGDADAMFVGNPGAFKKLRRAASDLLPVMFSEEVLTGEAKEWVKRGGYGTTMQYQELGDLNELKAFKLSLDRASKGGVLGLPAKAWNTYWKAARLSTDYREGLMRYAAYLSYLEQMQENNGVPKNFGASKKETVLAIPDVRDRAFKLSNELLGAYDRISEAGQTVRAFWIPFFSWMEVNATRYGRLVGNALDGGHGGTALAKGALITGKNGASFMIRLAFFWSTLQAWNYLMFGDDEDELQQTNPTVANRPHILFGRDAEGKIMYLAGIGALGDLLSWFGLDEFPGLVGDIMHDRLTIGEAVKNAAKAPVNRLWQGLTPLVKMPPEMFMRETSYPDVFHWRPIQDRAEYLGYQTTLGPEIKALMGKPGKPLYGVEDLSGLIVQKTDPKSAAYYSWQTTERKYLERMGKDSNAVFWRSPRGEALHNWSLALRHKDADAEAAWRERYVEMEKEKYGKRYSETLMYKDIERSLRSKAPLSGMTRAERDKILAQLDAEELRTLHRAEDYYKDVIMQILPEVRRSGLKRKLTSQGWLTKHEPSLLADLEP